MQQRYLKPVLIDKTIKSKTILTNRMCDMDFPMLMLLKDVDLIGVNEPEVNALSLLFSRRKTSEIPEPFTIGDKTFEASYPVITDESVPIIQIDFESYINYSITNESYTSWDEYEEFEGKAFRIYSKSRYLDFIKIHTFASKDYPGPFKHFGVVCVDHIVNIVSTSDPKIVEVQR